MNDEITAARRRKRRKYHIKRFGLFVSVLALAVLGMFVANAVTQTTFRDIADFGATLFAGGGGYPAELGTSKPVKVCEMSMAYAVLTEDELIIRSGRGAHLFTCAHSHVSADIAACGNRLALYNLGSRDVTVFNRTREIASFTTDNPIIDGAVGGDGAVALLTESERYYCQLEVYANGLYEKRMTWYGSGGFPLMCELSSSGGKAAVGCVTTDSGAIISEINVIDIGSGTQMTGTRVKGLLLGMRVYSDGGVLAVTDEGAYSLAPDGSVNNAVDFGGTPVLYMAFEDRSFAVAFGSNNKPAANFIRYFTGDLTEVFRADSCGRIADIYIAGGYMYTLGDGEIVRYNRVGEIESRYAANRNAFKLLNYYGIIVLRPDMAVRISDPEREDRSD